MADIESLLQMDPQTLHVPAEQPYATRDCGTLGDIRANIAARLSPLVQSRLDAHPARLVISMGRCRVGSTALTNLFGLAGLPSFFQPFKAVLRQHLHGQSDLDHIARLNAAPLVHAKEMFGPYTLAETLWNPFLDLAQYGLDPRRLSVIWLERDPLASLASWLHHWGRVLPRDVLVRNFILASHSAERAANAMEAAGAEVLAFSYDAIRSDPTAVLAVLDTLGIAHSLDPQDLNWGARGNLASPDSCITFVPEPAVYGAVKVHSNLPHYRHVTRDAGTVSDTERTLLERHGIFEMQDRHRARCVGLARLRAAQEG